MTGAAFVRHEPVMGTVVSLTADGGSAAALKEAFDEAVAEMRRLEGILSTWIADSPASRYRRGELAEDALPPELADVLDHSRRARRLTSGWFDPWSLPGGFDPTGLAKGWILERGCALLARGGVGGAVVNGGGDIATLGEPAGGGPRRVGIRHPWRRDAFACVLRLLAGEAVATSGTYERGAHFVDPFASLARTPTTPAVSASVVAGSLTMADAVATALASAGESASGLFPTLSATGFECYVILQDGRELATSDFPFAPARDEVQLAGG